MTDKKNNAGIGNSGNLNTGNLNTGDRNSGDRNTGNLNTGDRNTGNLNTGDWNSGNWNSGDLNTGDWNTGNLNTGDWNSGNWNSGDRNSGNWNSGNWNSGDRNSGNWNSGNWNSGYLNTDEPKVRIFGKETDTKREDIVFPDFMYFDNNIWVKSEDMTEAEKIAYPEHETTGGFLKVVKYKEAFKNSWEELSSEEKERQYKMLTELPNWNPGMFYEISGIDFREGYKKQDDKTEEAIALLKKDGYKIVK